MIKVMRSGLVHGYLNHFGGYNLVPRLFTASVHIELDGATTDSCYITLCLYSPDCPAGNLCYTQQQSALSLP